MIPALHVLTFSQLTVEERSMLWGAKRNVATEQGIALATELLAPAEVVARYGMYFWWPLQPVFRLYILYFNHYYATFVSCKRLKY